RACAGNPASPRYVGDRGLADRPDAQLPQLAEHPGVTPAGLAGDPQDQPADVLWCAGPAGVVVVCSPRSAATQRAKARGVTMGIRSRIALPSRGPRRTNRARSPALAATPFA